MKVAVLMSTYNGEKYIREQVESILNQSGDFQLSLIVRDDGSNDNTISILKEYEELGKLKWYSGGNLGPAKSFIDLLWHEKGYDYYAFSDQDDYWNNDKILNAIKALENQEVPALYFSNVELVDSELNPIGRNLFHSQHFCDFFSLFCSSQIIGCTVLINSKFAKIIQAEQMPSKILMHDAYLGRVCAGIGGNVIYDSRPSMKYRQHSENMIGAQTKYFQLLKFRISSIISQKKYPIEVQASEIILLYGKYLTNQNLKICTDIKNYKKSLFTRIKIACNRKAKYYSKNLEITARLSFFLGTK